MNYDIFISYRRKTGTEYARILKAELTSRGYKVFIDFDELKDGAFGPDIMRAIEDAPIFLLILSEGSLDDCVKRGDWVREEISYAHKKKRHFVPVVVNKSFKKIPDNLPRFIKKILGHNFSHIDTEALLQVSVDKMVKERIEPFVKKSHEKTIKAPVGKRDKGVEIHIDTDADCDLFRSQKLVTSLSAKQDNIIYLKPGKHTLTFVSKLYPEIRETLRYNSPSDSNSGNIQIRLGGKIEQRIDYYEEERITNQIKNYNIPIILISIICSAVFWIIRDVWVCSSFFISSLSLLIPTNLSWMFIENDVIPPKSSRQFLCLIYITFVTCVIIGFCFGHLLVYMQDFYAALLFIGFLLLMYHIIHLEYVDFLVTFRNTLLLLLIMAIPNILLYLTSRYYL